MAVVGRGSWKVTLTLSAATIQRGGLHVFQGHFFFIWVIPSEFSRLMSSLTVTLRDKTPAS